jgi:tetratricopeptide (TPR) repeat protein
MRLWQTGNILKMDIATFEKLIVKDAEITQTEAILLEGLQEAFPYCQSAHILIAKESEQKKSMLYPKKLRKASTYILDRRVLQQFLTTPTNQNLTTNSIVNPQNTVIEEIENTIREIKASKEKVFNTLEKYEKHKNENTSIETPIFYPRISASESRLGEEIIQTESKSSIELFISYLNQGDNISKSDNTLNQVEIINKFIETEPKITRSISNNFVEDKTHDLSINSTELKIDLVTENYALILLKQNKREKAKEIYKKLILKNPNKSAYFEAKLNEI